MKKIKILLTAVNAKYIHSNIAVRYLKRFAEDKVNSDIDFAEFTINQYVSDIFAEIYKASPDIIGFSCYLWNIEHIKKLTGLIRKIMPDTKIFLGGPEISYDVGGTFNELSPDFLIFGEGEETFSELVKSLESDCPDFSEINGLAYMEKGRVKINSARKGMDLGLLPFPYSEEDFKNLEHRIMYYEASRGCPFHCQYCLSSIEKNVRFAPIEKVRKELKIFIDHKVPQVKFVDRTFNANRQFALDIINFAKENDNGVTNFHFEVAAELLTEKILSALETARKGLFQLEIGVQSTNPETLRIIRRVTDLPKIKECTDRLNKAQNINLHLDLIAGLPLEDYKSFKKSYNDVFALHPHQLQLGFLKLLKGAGMEGLVEPYGIVCSEFPPYEVLKTDVLPFSDVLRLKGIEDLTEIYYNSLRFRYSWRFLVKYFPTPFDFFESLSAYRNEKSVVSLTNNKQLTYAFLYQFAKDMGYSPEIFKWILKFDMLLHENMKTNPLWLDIQNTDEENRKINNFYITSQNLYELLPEYEGMHPKQIAKYAHIERFPFNPLTLEKKTCYLLFNYRNCDIYGNATFQEIEI